MWVIATLLASLIVQCDCENSAQLMWMVKKCVWESGDCMPVYASEEEYGNFLIKGANGGEAKYDLDDHIELQGQFRFENSSTVPKTLKGGATDIIQPGGLKCDEALCHLSDCNAGDDFVKEMACLMAYKRYKKKNCTDTKQNALQALCQAGNTISQDKLKCYQIALAKPIGRTHKFTVMLEYEFLNPSGMYKYAAKRVVDKAISTIQCNEQVIRQCRGFLKKYNVNYVYRCRQYMSTECTDWLGSKCQQLPEFKYKSQCENLCTDFNKMEECWSLRTKIGVTKDNDKYGCTKFAPTGCKDKTKLGSICRNYTWGLRCSQIRNGANLVKQCTYIMPEVCLRDHPDPPSYCEEIWGPKAEGLKKLRPNSASNSKLILICVGLVLAVLVLSLCMACICCLIVRSQKKYIVEKEERAQGGTITRRQGDVTIAETLRSTAQMVRAKPNAGVRGGSVVHSGSNVRRR